MRRSNDVPGESDELRRTRSKSGWTRLAGISVAWKLNQTIDMCCVGQANQDGA